MSGVMGAVSKEESGFQHLELSSSGANAYATGGAKGQGKQRQARGQAPRQQGAVGIGKSNNPGKFGIGPSQAQRCSSAPISPLPDLERSGSHENEDAGPGPDPVR